MKIECRNRLVSFNGLSFFDHFWSFQKDKSNSSIGKIGKTNPNPSPLKKGKGANEGNFEESRMRKWENETIQLK